MINPGKIFENVYGGGKTEACPIKTIAMGVTVGTDRVVVAAVAGKRILVIGGTCFSNGAYTRIDFKSGAGGPAVRIFAIPANTVATPNVQIVPTLYDTFETGTEIALVVDNTTVAATLCINYLEYTP